MRTAGCCANGIPAVAVADGCVWMVSLLAAAGFTMYGVLVSGRMAGWVTFDAVRVWKPAVLLVTATVRLPTESAPLAGKEAKASLATSFTTLLVLIKFQLASTERIVTLKTAPAVCAVGAPVLPVDVPGTGVSPGSSTCSFAKAPRFTVMAGLVFAVLVPSSTSVAVTVRVPPAVRNVTLNTWVPPTKAALGGKVALGSVVVMPTVSPMAPTRFQLASTAFTVTLKGVPAVRAVGVPVLPEVVPGAAVSPGTNNCSLTKGPGLTVKAGLVLAVNTGATVSVAVTVHEPAVLLVITKFRVPATSAALAGLTSLASVVSMETVLTSLTRFQLASTAFTVTV